MKKLNEIVVILFGRLNSTRIPQKMIKPFAGTTLMDIAIEKILTSSLILKENIYLFVHDQELVDIGKKHNINILLRSEKSANAESNIKDIHEWRDKLDYKYVVTFNACTPFLKIDTIDGFIKYYMKSEHEGLFGVIEKNNLFWNHDGTLLTASPAVSHAPNTKTAQGVYEAAHCLYASKIEWLNHGVWLGSFQKHNDPELYVLPECEVFDIDHPWQFEMAECVYKLQHKLCEGVDDERL